MSHSAERITPSEKSLLAKAAVHISWANTADPKARTLPARKAGPQRLEWFEKQVDPTGELPPAERTRRAEHGAGVGGACISRYGNETAPHAARVRGEAA